MIALVIGATGLVGSYLFDQLLADTRFTQVKVFTRRTSGKKSDKLLEFLVDFNKVQEWGHDLTGDVLFSALGTTLKKAGSKEVQYMIDFTYQYESAVHAAGNGVVGYVLVSSAGASSSSRVFYSRMKGELEDAVSKLPFKHIHIIRPGILDGPRSEPRPAEQLGLSIFRLFKYIPGIRQFRPVHAATVAKAMINAALDESEGIKKYTLEEVFALADR